jgi:dsRNA-specific ribonuclease
MNNPNNKLISKEQVEHILNYLGPIGDNGSHLTINNLEYYQRAFINESYHQSVCNYFKEQTQNNVNLVPFEQLCFPYVSKESNERLEYLGDHVLKTIASRYLYKRFPTEREGFLTRLKIKIEKCSMLHKMALSLGFKEYLLLSLQVENQTILDTFRGRNTPSYYEDAFESFLGAIMEDFDEKGYIYAERFVVNVIEHVVDFAELISTNDNFKDSLQRYFQQLKWKTPVYISIQEQGPIYRKVFTRILPISKEQFDQLDPLQQHNIQSFTIESLKYYKTMFPDIYLTLSKYDYILCIGSDRKVVSAEQNCAKIGLQILNLPLNF